MKKFRFLVSVQIIFVLSLILFIFGCKPSTSGTTTYEKTTALVFVNKDGQAITALPILKKGVPEPVRVQTVPSNAVDNKYSIEIVTDSQSEAADYLEYNAQNRTIFCNRYGAKAKLRAILQSDPTIKSKEYLQVVVEDAVPEEITEPKLVVDNNEVVIDVAEGLSIEIENSTILPEGSGHFEGTNPTKFIVGDNVPNGTLITAKATLSDGSIVVYNIVKGEVIAASNIAINNSEDFVILPGQPASIPLEFESAGESCTYHEAKYITFESDNPDYITVENGKVCMASNTPFGTSATITGTSRDGNTFSFNVVNNTYTPSEDYDLSTGSINVLQLLNASGVVLQGGELTSCIPESAATYNSDNGELTISSDDNAVPLGTLITCTLTYQDGTSKTFNIVKGSIIPLISISAEDITVSIGGSVQIVPEFNPQNATYKGWSVSKASTCNLIDENASDIDNGYIVIYNDAQLAGESTTLTLSSTKYPSVTSPILLQVTDCQHVYGEWSQTVAPTCIEAGSHQRICSKCGYIEAEPVQPLGHDLITITTPATCTESGSITRDCSRCDYKETEVIPALGHTVDESIWESDDEHHWHICSVCSEIISESLAEHSDDPCTICGWNSGPVVLSGEFTINSNGDKIHFVKGNLYWDGSTFKTEENQFDYRTWPEYPSVINGISGTTKAGEVGLFSWSININKTMDPEYDGNGNSSSATFALANGGAISGFDVLTKSEWSYLLSRGSSRKYGLATITTKNNVQSIGIVLLPDNFSTPQGLTWSYGKGNGYNTNSYTYDNWISMENAGAVFIPAAGVRYYDSVSNPNVGLMWLKNAEGANRGYSFRFGASGSIEVRNDLCYTGLDVRLVKR